ncbi:hypothetical protein [Anaerobacillus alkaliphilus]|uniref:hypothetical protein n=1 Tax=Anaerobacillus alkaliphilus TaxID=1548597 RepID=UPI0013760A97|nr:hypothetical protein [Anaerobacillus alkaliphilus]
MKKLKTLIGRLVVCAVIAMIAFVSINNKDVPLDLNDRIVLNHSAPAASVMLNI